MVITITGLEQWIISRGFPRHLFGGKVDLYIKIDQNASKLIRFVDWPDLQAIFFKASSAKPRQWRLPQIACESVGGDFEISISAVSAIAFMHIGILIIDDMLDEDPRGEYNKIGAGQAANVAFAFQSLGLEAISFSRIKSGLKARAFQILNKMSFLTSYGQEVDSRNLTDELSYWQVAQTKSSSFFSAAFELGALVGEASLEICEQFKQLGGLYGEMIQIHDDLNDTLSFPANPDWVKGRFPLPILFASIVQHPDQERFLELKNDTQNSASLKEAQSILIRCGAVSYCIDQILERHKKAEGILSQMQLKNSKVIKDLLDEAVYPIQNLLQARYATHL
jgi:octaprenyl-diphosphate synthase